MSSKKLDEARPDKPILEAREKREVKNLPIDRLFVGELNERLNVGDLTGLVASIKEVGVLVPLMVRPVAEKFELIAGRRRFEASRAAGLTVVPCVVKELNDIEAMRASYEENEHRQSASPVEEGYQCYKMLNRLQDISKVADLLGKSAVWVKARVEAYELHKIAETVISAKGPRGMVEGVTAPGIGIVDATQVQAALRSRSVERYLTKVPEKEKYESRQRLAKNLVEAIRVVDPIKKAKLVTEFRKNPGQDLKGLADKLSNEPRGLKLSVYFPPEIGRFVEELADKSGLAPSKWVLKIVTAHLERQGHEIPSVQEIVR